MITMINLEHDYKIDRFAPGRDNFVNSMFGNTLCIELRGADYYLTLCITVKSWQENSVIFALLQDISTSLKLLIGIPIYDLFK